MLRINVWPVSDCLFGAPSKSAPVARAPLAPPKGRPCIVTKYARNLGQHRSLVAGIEAVSSFIAIRRVAAMPWNPATLSHYLQREVKRYGMIVMKWCRATCEEWKWTWNVRFRHRVPGCGFAFRNSSRTMNSICLSRAFRSWDLSWLSYNFIVIEHKTMCQDNRHKAESPSVTVPGLKSPAMVVH
jgi:hypothetical protein